MTKHLVAVYRGPIWQAKIRQAQLDGYGIPNFVPEPDVQRPSGGIGGAPLYQSCVLVPAECEEDARAVLDYSPDAPAEHEPS